MIKKTTFTLFLTFLYVFNINANPLLNSAIEQYSSQAETGTSELQKIEDPRQQSMLQAIKNVFNPPPLIKSQKIFELESLALVDKLYKIDQHNQPISTDELLNQKISATKKLALFKGDSDSPKSHLVNMLGGKDIQTTLGLYELISTLAEPITDISLIKQRQEALKELLENKSLSKKLATHIKKIATKEHYILEFFRPENDLKKDIEKLVYFGDFFSRYNKNSSMLECQTRLMQLSLGFNSIILPGSLSLIGLLYPIFGSRYLINEGMRPASAIGSTSAFYLLCFALPSAYSSALFIGTFKNWMSSMNYIHDQMIGVASTILEAEKIYLLLKDNHVIRSIDPVLFETCDQLFNEISTEPIHDFINLMSKNTFKGSATIFSWSGTILKAYKRFYDLKEQLLPMYKLIGTTDAFISVANHIQKHNQLSNHYHFTTFVENSTGPIFEGSNIWNPFVKPESAIGNDISLGGQENTCFLLTGPNKGGKTTLMKSVVLNAWTSQTFGIFAGNSLIMTPFTFLGVHLNEEDSVTGNVSHFQAQARKAKNIIEVIRSLQPQEKSFILLDEMFSGTSPEQDIKETHKFLLSLLNHENCCFIAATHHADLTQMQDSNARIKNMHMGAITDENGRVIKYTYKLENGASPVRNADQVLEDEGIVW